MVYLIKGQFLEPVKNGTYGRTMDGIYDMFKVLAPRNIETRNSSF